jgi:outer membrane protein
MKSLSLTIACAALLAGGMTGAHAQSTNGPGFYAALGYYSVRPQSNNGTLAHTFKTTVSNDSKPTLTLGYRFDSRWSAELWTPISKFQHDVNLNGAKSASIKHRPYLVTAQFHFMPGQSLQPFVGVGYGWVNVSDERTTGAIAGTHLSVDHGNGLTAQFGLDYYATSHVFVRADARYFEWKSGVQLNGAGIGTVKVNPWIYGVNVGYRF